MEFPPKGRPLGMSRPVSTKNKACSPARVQHASLDFIHGGFNGLNGEVDVSQKPEQAI